MNQLDNIIESYINDWEIVREIGRGASGTVYEIRKKDHDVEMTCALKVIEIPHDQAAVSVLRQEGMNDRQIFQYFQGTVDEVTEEIKMMISLKGSPYVVNCEEFLLVKDPDRIHWTILIRMEKLTPLSIYQKQEAITEAVVVKIAESLLKALRLLEEKNIMHRDIKPDNILVSRFGDFKLSDFGIARICEKGTENLSQKGTINYMAPEVYNGQPYNRSVDIYSLGLVLYKLLNKNRLPFFPLTESYTAIMAQRAILDRMHGEKKLPPPVNASPEIARIILKMCEYAPEKRYHSASEVLKDLHRVNLLSGTKSTEIIDDFDATGYENRHKDNEYNLTHSVYRDGLDDSVFAVSLTDRNGIASDVDSGRKEKTPFLQTEISDSQSSGHPETQQDKKNGKEGNGSHNHSLRKKVILILAAGIILLLPVILYINSFKYEFVVNGGSGGGKFKKGTQITAVAEKKSGYTFDHWETDDIALSTDDAAKETVKLEMPSQKVTLTAVYTLNSYKLTVNNGYGAGEYAAGQQITLSADPLKNQMQFSCWTVDKGTLELADYTAPNIVFAMPAADVTVTAHYIVATYTVKVISGSGNGKYSPGDIVTIHADAVDQSGAVFSRWTVESGPPSVISDVENPDVSFIMPSEDLVIRANYAVTESVESTDMTEVYYLSVNGGTGSGYYAPGSSVLIAHDTVPGETFVQWIISVPGSPAEISFNDQLTYTMPDSNVNITAVYSG